MFLLHSLEQLFLGTNTSLVEIIVDLTLQHQSNIEGESNILL